MEQVDAIGTESICKIILASKSVRFILYKKGYLKGSAPLYKCVDTNSPKEAETGFRNWANTILSSNPSNNLPYEIMMYTASVNEDDIEDDIDGGEKTVRGKQKNRSKLSFALNPYNNMGASFNGGGLSITEVSRLLDERDQKRELEMLKEENRRLRERGDDDEDEDDEEDDDDISDSALSKAIEFMREANKNARLKLKSKGIKVSGDLEDDDDEDDLDDEEEDELEDDDDNEEEENDEDDEDDNEEDDDDEDDEPQRKKSSKNKSSSGGIAMKKKKAQRIIKAIRVLQKSNSNLDSDLMKLAVLSQKKPKIYKNMLIQLRGLKF